MSAFPNSARLVKGGLVLVDPDTGTVQKIIVLQYNQGKLARSWQACATNTNNYFEGLLMEEPSPDIHACVIGATML